MASKYTVHPAPPSKPCAVCRSTAGLLFLGMGACASCGQRHAGPRPPVPQEECRGCGREGTAAVAGNARLEALERVAEAALLALKTHGISIRGHADAMEDLRTALAALPGKEGA